MSPKNKSADADTPAAPTAAYEAAIADYTKGIEAMRKGDHAAAKVIFDNVRASNPEEPELGDRARAYSKICDRHLTPPTVDSNDPDQRFYRAVILINRGEWDQALGLLDGLLQEDPTSVRALYARASAWALKGVADRVVTDLRQAIAVDPKVRFQAVNDADFERVREEPAFIDIIEPTPSGH